ncbi:MAG: accessory gene regulator B family protein [bacterium]|nr:accessory gene regulator B family protein [bacterium]
MFHAFSERIIAYAVKNGLLDSEKAEEYIYGLELSISVSASYISVLLIGFIMGMLPEAALFLFLYVTIRRFAGGFHFESQVVCFLSMYIISPLTFLIIRHGGDSIQLWSIVMAASVLTILLLSPVPAVEKPIDTKENVIYGRISRAISIIVSIIYVVLCFSQHIYIAKIISSTMCVVAILEILGKIKYILHNRL